MPHPTPFRGPALALATLVGFCGSAAAQAPDPGAGLWVDRVAEGLFQTFLNAARSTADIRFAGTDIRPLDGYLSLTGLHIRPYDQTSYGACSVKIDEIVLSGAPFFATGFGTMRALVSGAEVAVGCLPPGERAAIAAMGFERFNLEHAMIDARFEMASGALDLDMHLLSQENAELFAEARFAYFAINALAEEPVIDLSYARVTAVNGGLWDQFSDMVPPALLNAEMLAGLLSQELLAPGAGPAPGAEADTPSGGSKPGDAQPDAPAPLPQAEESPQVAMLRDAIASVAEAVEAFGREPTRLTLELSPPEPVRLTPELTQDFGVFLRALRPSLRHGALTPTDLAPDLVEALSAAVSGDTDSLSREIRLDLAAALMAGQGMPRNPALAVEILAPLLQADDPEALRMGIGHPDLFTPEAFYDILLSSAAGGNPEAYLALNAAEERLGLDGVLAAQGGIVSSFDPADGVEAYVSQARAALRGHGTRRNYAQAYYLALLGEALGDPAAGATVDQIEDMGRLFADPEAWAALLHTTRSRALADWVAASE